MTMIMARCSFSSLEAIHFQRMRYCVLAIIALFAVPLSAQTPAGQQVAPAPEGAKTQLPSPIKVIVNEKPVAFEGQGPKEVKGRVLVPLRAIFEALGAYVEYDSVFRKVTASVGADEVSVTIGERIATHNGVQMVIDVAPEVANGKTLVPLRFIAESLGAKVDYDDKTRTITISTKDTPPEP